MPPRRALEMCAEEAPGGGQLTESAGQGLLEPCVLYHHPGVTEKPLLGGSLSRHATHSHQVLRIHACISWSLQSCHLTHSSFVFLPILLPESSPRAPPAFFSFPFCMALRQRVDSHPLPTPTALAIPTQLLGHPPTPAQGVQSSPCAVCQHLHLPDTAHTAC